MKSLKTRALEERQSLLRQLGGSNEPPISKNFLSYLQDEFAQTNKKRRQKESEKEAWRIEPVGPEVFARDYINYTPSEPQMEIMNEIFAEVGGDVIFTVDQVVLKVGQGGGKNYEISWLTVYAIYLWCCLENPHAFAGDENGPKPVNKPFDILIFSQVNAEQAKHVFYNELAGLMRNTIDPATKLNWFESHTPMIVHQDYGMKGIKDKTMVVPNRNHGFEGLVVHVLDSQGKSGEGYTTWMSIMDEPSRANTPKKYAQAKLQYNTTLTNQETRFMEGHRLMAVFSYPEQETNDLTVELYNEHAVTKEENSHSIKERVLTAWYNTWTFNNYDIAGKKKKYAKALKLDEIDAKRRWRAIVPPNVFGFFNPHFEKIDECANPKLESPVKASQYIKYRDEYARGEPVNKPYTALELTEVIGDLKDRWWGGDFALSGDTLTLFGGYAKKLERPVQAYQYHERNEKGIEVQKSMVIDVRPVIDVILKWRPKPGQPIDYQNVEDVILDLLGNHFPNSHSLHFDNFNTESIRVKLVDIGVKDCETISFSNAVQVKLGRQFRHLVWNNAIDYLDDATLKHEMSKVLLINNSKIDHTDEAGKDCYDSAIICTDLIMTNASSVHGWAIPAGEEMEAEEQYSKVALEYQKALKSFDNNFGRSPQTHDEMALWFKDKYHKNYTVDEVAMMREEFIDMMGEMKEKVMGLKEYNKHLSVQSGEMSPQNYEDSVLYADDLMDEQQAPNQTMVIQPRAGGDDGAMGG